MSDEIKAALNTLIAKESFLFLIGAVILLFVALNGSSISGKTIVLTNLAIVVFSLLGITLMAFGCVPMIKAWRQPPAKPQRTPMPLPVGNDFRKDLEEQLEQTTRLKQAIYEIRAIVLNERSSAANQILQIINQLNIAVMDYEISTNQSVLTVQWFRERVDTWVEAIRSEDYPYIDEVDIEKFKEDVKKCLDLVQYNIETGMMYPPRYRNIKFQCKSAYSYGAAMEQVKTAINQELQAFPQYGLNPNQIREVLDCIEEMKDGIFRHFNKGYND